MTFEPSILSFPRMARYAVYRFDLGEDEAALWWSSGSTDGHASVVIISQAFRILSFTACGAWIDEGGGKKRFVNLRACKQWACATVDEAIAQLKHRKRRQVAILASRLAEAEDVLAGLMRDVN